MNRGLQAYLAGLLLIVTGNSLAEEQLPLTCYEPGETLAVRVQDLANVGPDYPWQGYISVVKFEFRDQFARRAKIFEDKQDGRLGAVTLFDDLVIPVTGFGKSLGEKREYTTFDLPGLSQSLAITERVKRLRQEPDKQAMIAMTKFVVLDKIELIPDHVGKIAYFAASQSVSIQPTTFEIEQEIESKIGRSKSSWRCFVAGREAEGWSVDKNQSPPVLHFKLK